MNHPRAPERAEVHCIDEAYIDALAAKLEGTALALLLQGPVDEAPPPGSRSPVRIDGAYVIDEARVDRLADRHELALLLPSWRWDDVPWRSIVE